MPELVEVELATRFINDMCRGKTIKSIKTKESGGGPRDKKFDDIVCTASEKALKKAMVGNTVVEAQRHGKYMWWKMKSRPYPTFHFGMSGSFKVKGVVTPGKYVRDSMHASTASSWPPKFSKMIITMTDGTQVAFVNIRRLGRIGLQQDPFGEDPVASLGYDPFKFMPLDGFKEALKLRGVAVKAALLDQAFTAGVGNWIADETLYQARVHPVLRCCDLTSAQATAIHKALLYVVTTAVKEPEHVNWPKNWLFHYRWAKKKAGQKDAQGNPIKFMTVGGRTTAVVEKVQGRFAPRAATRMPKPPKILNSEEAAAAGAAAAEPTEPAEPKKETKKRSHARTTTAAAAAPVPAPAPAPAPKPRSKAAAKPAASSTSKSRRSPRLTTPAPTQPAPLKRRRR